MALGDSITAGLLATSSRNLGPQLASRGEQSSFQRVSVAAIDEYRGVSYPTGNDPGAISIASIMSHYSPNMTGISYGHHPTIVCPGGKCERPEQDGLNMAVSGSLAKDMFGQVQGELTVRRTAFSWW